MSWLKSAMNRTSKLKSDVSLFGGQNKPETSAPRNQTPSRNEISTLSSVPRQIENVDKTSFDKYHGSRTESTGGGIKLGRPHEHEADLYGALPSNIKLLRSGEAASESRPSISSQASFVSSTSTVVTGSVPASNTIKLEDPGFGPNHLPKKLSPEASEKDLTLAQQTVIPSKTKQDHSVEEPVIKTEAALLAKDPFFYERLEFHVNDAESSMRADNWELALDNIEVVYDIFKGVDIVLMMADHEKFLLLQRVIVCRSMSVLAARGYAESVLTLSEQWRSLLKKEGLVDTFSRPWVDLVRILAYMQLGKYEDAHESCQRYLRPDYIKIENVLASNDLLNGYGFWLMREILRKQEKLIEAAFYSSRIPNLVLNGEGIYHSWLFHCLSRSGQGQAGTKNLRLRRGT